MVKDILQIGTPILTQKTNPVTEIDSPETKRVISDLLDTIKKNKTIAAGLAAPQIGYHKSICICRRTDLEESGEAGIEDDELWQVMINPEVVDRSDDDTVIWEACLSIGTGKEMLHGPVRRAADVKVKYFDIKGEEKALSGDDFFSHVMQHEIDHLNGVLFIKYVSNPNNIWRSEDLDEYFEHHNTYPDIV